MQNLYSVAQAHKTQLIQCSSIFNVQLQSNTTAVWKITGKLTGICILPSMTEPKDEKLLLDFGKK